MHSWYRQFLLLTPWVQTDFTWRPTVITRKRLITGDYGGGPVMERQVNGEAQYRRMTDRERADWDAETAW